MTATHARNITAETGDEFVAIWAAGYLSWPAEDTPTIVNKVNYVRDSGRFVLSHLAACG